MARHIILLFLLLQIVFLQGCVKDQLTRKYTLLKPVYKEKALVLQEIEIKEARSISNAGKIYVYGNFLFVNEVNKGVHVIDNVNPAKPVNKGFINIPGNVDIAVKGNFLYADIFTDMLAIDITNPLNVKVTSVIPNVFPERQYSGVVIDTSRYIIDWVAKDTVVDMNNLSSCFNCGVFWNFSNGSAEANQASFSKITTGISGSMARFTIVDNFLYAVNLYSLIAFDISNRAVPEQKNASYVGWNIETVYPFKGNLFIGSATGMFIFNVSTPSQPSYQGRIEHLRFCDPVIADDNYAYVTLRAGAECGNITGSSLQIMDISNITSPVLVKTYPMDNPYGLGLSGNLLWICDGEAGLKIFDGSNPLNLKPKYHFKNLEPFDVIPTAKSIIVSSKEGIVQFSVGIDESVVEISRINKQK